jgi:hypothetical protein
VTYEEQRTAADRLARVYSDNPAGIEYGDECLYSAFVLLRSLVDRMGVDLADTRAKLQDADQTILRLGKLVNDNTRTRMVAALAPKEN